MLLKTMRLSVKQPVYLLKIGQIQYILAGDENGLPQGIAETLPKKAQLRVHASQETWMRIHQRQLSGKKAFLTQQLPFRGSMLILLKYMDPFNTTFRRMGDIPATF